MVNQALLSLRINIAVRDQLHYRVTPQHHYTQEEIQKATYVLINPDDLNYQLGFEPKEEIPAEAFEHQHGILEYPDMPNMYIIFIY